MFIVIEGLDGSGKSTQLKLLKNFLSEHDIAYAYLHFPRTDRPFFGQMIARFLRGEFGTNHAVDPYLVALLYAGDRFDAAHTIQQWLKENKLVVVDRYVCSNIAYQCAKINDKQKQTELKNWIIDLEYNYFRIPRPDLNIFLDVPLQFVESNLRKERKGDDRNYLLGTADIHEQDISFQQKVRQVYISLEKFDSKFKIIPCYDNHQMLSTEIIFFRILNMLKEYKVLNSEF